MNKYATIGEATDREYQRGEMRVFRRRPLRRLDKLVSVLLGAILQVRPSHNMRMHCSQRVDSFQSLLEVLALRHDEVHYLHMHEVGRNPEADSTISKSLDAFVIVAMAFPHLN
jgi:hypothetical protein